MKTEILSYTDKEALEVAISKFCEGKKVSMVSTTSIKHPESKVGIKGTELSIGGFAAHHYYPETTYYTTTILYEEVVE